jgi:hypothetical protein
MVMGITRNSHTEFDYIIMPLDNHSLNNSPPYRSGHRDRGGAALYPSEFRADLLVDQNWTQRYYRDKVLIRQRLGKCVQDTPHLG